MNKGLKQNKADLIILQQCKRKRNTDLMNKGLKPDSRERFMNTSSVEKETLT